MVQQATLYIFLIRISYQNLMAGHLRKFHKIVKEGRSNILQLWYRGPWKLHTRTSYEHPRRAFIQVPIHAEHLQDLNARIAWRISTGSPGSSHKDLYKITLCPLQNFMRIFTTSCDFACRCSTSYDLASLFRGKRSTLDRWNGKIAKRIGTRPSALHSTFHFWRKSRRIASLLMLSTSKFEDVLQNWFVLKLWPSIWWESVAGLLRLGHVNYRFQGKYRRIALFCTCQLLLRKEVSHNCWVSDRWMNRW